MVVVVGCRQTGCKYWCIGCPWRGPAHELTAHEARCAHPHKSAADVLDVLAERDRCARDETLVYNQLLNLLSYEKITITGLLFFTLYHTQLLFAIFSAKECDMF